jgi:hypothetical protein
MSPTADDLRALLEQRAEAAPPDLVRDGASVPRLAGVRQRIRRRRRARAGAAALSLALLAGSAAVATAQLHDRDRAVQPAFPLVDDAHRPLAAKLSGEGAGVHWQNAHLDKGWADLHLAARCTGGDAVSAVVLVDGRVVAQKACAGGTADVTVTRDQATSWGLAPDTSIATVGLHLVRTPEAGAAAVTDAWAILPPAHGELAVYTKGRRLPLPEYTSDGAPAQGGVGRDTHLASASLPISKDFGTQSVTVVTSSPYLASGLRCTVPDSAPSLGVLATLGGKLLGAACIGDHANAYMGFGPDLDPQAWEALGLLPGRPITVDFRVVRVTQDQLERGSPTDLLRLPDLRQDVPGASVALDLEGLPYVPGTPATPGQLDPPAAKDSEGRPLAVNLVAQPGRPASVTVRLRSGRLDLAPSCAGSVQIAATSDAGWGLPPQACQGSIGRVSPHEPPGRVRTIRLSAGDGDPTAGVAQLALYGDVEVLAVVQPAVASLGNGALPALPSSPGPEVGIDGDDATPRTAEITVAGGHSAELAVVSEAGWGYQTACTSARTTGTGTLSLDGAARALDCTPRGEVRAPGLDAARRLTVAVRPGTGYVKLALHGATVVQVSGS